ncbi:hypothetical protein KFL_001110170 [Klebsormidium nitens]|uniref:GDT1 family protein n=1 Tax=Klebsormidium nitens TaxID=105231 RepID=A0A1Y1HZT7_KLENI|nr:hypothetical protein KFL_001110170 [Klebsormidium nitens]|eukprot:GAQ82441.1 hypothetical protein KFL_001110170 [Klebsormidium nitens]
MVEQTGVPKVGQRAGVRDQIGDRECRAVAGTRQPSELSTKPVSQAATTLILGLAALLLAGGATEPAVAAELNSNLGSNLAASFDLFEDLGNLREGFVSAFLLIFFSEIGDKTFFIAVLLALKRNKVAVFAGTFGALAVMTFITVILGRVFHVIDEALPFDKTWEAEIPLDDVAAVLLLIYFGLSTLKDAYTAEEGDGDEEKESAEAAVASFGDGAAALSGFDFGTVAATFALVFAAEWGDKSFFSTIALAAAGSPLGVVGGAVVGHGVATVLAVVGGSILSRYISPKIIGYAGGSLFLVFAAVTLFDITSKLP